MKKLMLDIESLSVETFAVVDSPETLRGTVKGASGTDPGTYPSNGCPATMLLSGCLSRCRPSGPIACLSPPPC